MQLDTFTLLGPKNGGITIQSIYLLKIQGVVFLKIESLLQKKISNMLNTELEVKLIT